MSLKPINNCVLVKLTGALEYVDTIEKQYSTKTSGVVVAVPDDDVEHSDHSFLLNKRVYFEDFKDGTKVDEEHALIKISDIRGYDDDETI